MMVPIDQWEVKKNTRVLLVSRHEVPIIKIDLVFNAGSSRDGEQYGLSQLTNAMLNQGTEYHSAEEISALFDEIGANFSATADRDMAVISLECLSDKKYLAPALTLFLEILQSVNFPEDAFQQMQKQILNGILRQKQSPENIAKNTFFNVLYPNHPYGNPVLGTHESVAKLTTDDLKQFFSKYYVSHNAFFVIVGDIDRQSANTIANKIIKALIPGSKAADIAIAKATDSAADCYVAFPSSQTHILMGHVGMSYQHPDYYALTISNHILGGSSLISKLFTEIRGKHGLVYSISSHFMPLMAQGPFVIILQTRNTVLNQTLDLVNKIVSNYIHAGPSKDEILLAKKILINEFPLHVASNKGISLYLIRMGFYRLPLDYLETYQAKIAAVTFNQIKQATQNNIFLDQLIKVVVGQVAAETSLIK